MISTLLFSSVTLFTALDLEPPQAAPVLRDGVLEEDSVLVRYDLGPVLPSYDAAGGWSHSLNRGFEMIWGHECETPNVAQIYEGASPETVSELIRQLIGDELTSEGRLVSLEGDSSLLVLAPAAVQARVKRAMDGLAQGFGSSVSLQIDVVEMKGALGEDVPSSVPVAQAERFLQGLLARNGQRHSYKLDLSAGRTGVIDQRTSRSMVVDHDVEIAKGAVIFDPTVFAVEEGEFFALQATPFAGGSALSVVMSSAQLAGEPKTIELAMPSYVGKEDGGRMALMRGLELIQVGQLQQRSLAASTFLAKDQALVFASQLQQAGGDTSRVVLIRQLGDSAPGFKRVEFEGTNLSLILANAAAFDAGVLSFDQNEEEFTGEGWRPLLIARADTSHSSFLYEWAARNFSLWRRVGPWIAIVTNPEWDGERAKDLERLFQMVQPAQRVVGVDLRFGRTSGTLSPMRWSLPILEGSRCGVLLGTSSTAVMDIDVEVAGNASTKDPVVRSTFHGLSAMLGVSGNGTQRSVELRGSGTWRDLPGELFDLGSSQGVKFDQTRVRNMSFNHRAQVGGQKSVRLGGSEQGATTDAGLYLEVGLNP